MGVILMNEMVERVAKAIESAELKWKAENGGDTVSTTECPDVVKARAAIEAMREPTEAMWRMEQPLWSLGRPMWEWWKDTIDGILK